MLDLSKIQIPEGAVRVEIDDPEHSRILKPAGRIRGWFAASKLIDIPDTFTFRVGTILLPHRIVHRGDVEGALPEYAVTGFEIPYDIAALLPYVRKNQLAIQLTLPDYGTPVLKFHVADCALAICMALASES